MFAQVPEDEGLDAAIQIVFDEVTGDCVGQVAVAAHDALFNAPGVGADLEHLEIVVGLEKENLDAPEVDFDGIRDVAKVCGDADFDAVCQESEADGVNGVMRNREALDGHVTEHPAGTGLKVFDGRRGFKAFPLDHGRGEAGGVDGDGLLFSGAVADEAGEPEDVVGMFMGDENGIDIVRRFTDLGEAAGEFFDGESGVDENAGVLTLRVRRGQEGGISRAATGQYAELYDDNSP